MNVEALPSTVLTNSLIVLLRGFSITKGANGIATHCLYLLGDDFTSGSLCKA